VTDLVAVTNDLVKDAILQINLITAIPSVVRFSGILGSDAVHKLSAYPEVTTAPKGLFSLGAGGVPTSSTFMLTMTCMITHRPVA